MNKHVNWINSQRIRSKGSNWKSRKKDQRWVKKGKTSTKQVGFNSEGFNHCIQQVLGSRKNEGETVGRKCVCVCVWISVNDQNQWMTRGRTNETKFFYIGRWVDLTELEKIRVLVRECEKSKTKGDKKKQKLTSNEQSSEWRDSGLVNKKKCSKRDRLHFDNVLSWHEV